MAKRLRVLLLACVALLVISPAAWAAGGQAATITHNAACTTTGSGDYTLIHTVEVVNEGATYAANITVLVPLIDLDLPAYAELAGTELSPYPSRIVTGEDGHRYAVYNISYLRPDATYIITQKYAVTLHTVKYGFDALSVADRFSNAELAALAAELAATEDIQSTNGAIIAFAKAAVGKETNPYRIARILFSAVNLALTYDEDDNEQDALAVLSRKTGSCAGYTNLYIACLRALGVPARRQSGYLYVPADGAEPDASATLHLNNLGHTWVEFYLPSIGWVAADPTFTYTYEIGGQVEKFVDWSYFAEISEPRCYFYFRTGITDPDSADLTATGGRVSANFYASAQAGHSYWPFSDISAHWAAEAIVYCTERGLFNGMTPSAFVPNANMTRAMFVTVLGRLYEALEGTPVEGVDEDLTFTDTPADAYYAKYLRWAVDNHLISGYDETHFGPDDCITREQLCTIMANFLVRLYNNTAEAGPGLGFADKGQISDWAKTGVIYCTFTGLITGFEDNTFRPQNYATRAQAAAILQRMNELLAEEKN